MFVFVVEMVAGVCQRVVVADDSSDARPSNPPKARLLIQYQELYFGIVPLCLFFAIYFNTYSEPSRGYNWRSRGPGSRDTERPHTHSRDNPNRRNWSTPVHLNASGNGDSLLPDRRDMDHHREISLPVSVSPQRVPSEHLRPPRFCRHSRGNRDLNNKGSPSSSRRPGFQNSRRTDIASSRYHRRPGNVDDNHCEEDGDDHNDHRGPPRCSQCACDWQTVLLPKRSRPLTREWPSAPRPRVPDHRSRDPGRHRCRLHRRQSTRA
jgi:hypothetical protein